MMRRRCAVACVPVLLTMGGSQYVVGSIAAQAVTDDARGYHRLFAVSVCSRIDAWAVGFHGSGRQATTRHWDGADWSAVRNPVLSESLLLDVEAVSASDAWAVGQFAEGSLAEHWDGKQWMQAVVPQRGSNDALSAVSSASTDDVWAVGYGYSGTEPGTVTEHWDGSTWSLIPSPNADAAASYLDGVSVVGASDAWAVGRSVIEGISRPLIEHWDGTQWSIAPGPRIKAQLFDVTAVSSTDVWAAGIEGEGQGGPHSTFIVHWDGKTWARVASPGGSFASSELTSISAINSHDVWAVGGSGKNAYSPSQTLIVHWNGDAWVVVPSRSPGRGENFLAGVSARSPSDVWAVGHYAGGFRHYRAANLLEHWDGHSWR